MPRQHLSPPARARSTRPKTHRTRSNSLPIVEALGCSTPEARLLLAEGSAAVRRRRTRSQRDRSVHSDKATAFNPRDHLEFLYGASSNQGSDRQSILSEPRGFHARIPSDTTDNSSTSTLVPESFDSQPSIAVSITSPLGDYSANLADFIKSQLKNIPTYTPGQNPTSPLSPRSCPDLSFSAKSPLLSPDLAVKRPAEQPQIIEIPSIRPPMRSQFSAWSSTDDETDEDMFPVADTLYDQDAMIERDYHSSSVLSYYESAYNPTFLFPSTPLEEEEDPQTAKGTLFPSPSMRLGSPSEHGSPLHDTESPSSSLSRPQLGSSSAPSYTSTAPTLSYFDCKRPFSVTPELRDRILAAVTPPVMLGKTFAAISPWEGAALSNVHDVFVDSQQRVHVDGMAFDMQRDFILPSGISTPC